MQYVALCGKALLATVFLVSAWTKLRSPAAFGAFRRSTRRMAILPEPWVRPVAVLVVAAEVAIVLLLAVPLPVTALLGLGLAAVLLTGLALAIASTVRRGVRTTCQCFGHSDTPLGAVHIVRNLTLVAVAVAAAVTGARGGAVEFGAGLLAVLAGVLAGAVVTVLDDLRHLLRPVPPPKTSAARQGIRTSVRRSA
ncbi:MauE/DoxX family redox-associated membrane protein [Virgisporangium ochraceum]|uniref:Methylamine utilisation protein MauE domain-containing protein n=1 Tax=Virgisporangium ochraceum TaxID=65505 RepID=A0A8J3ZX73_9ACTN|nr:MauE/DoxX family redox-associated membrane protein [Virgisporangium ochraceum]GIJ70582.1 hypothetical protein Voc01_054990 [Virgisporangium ochraceum]